MNHKRTILISTVAVLAVVLIAFLAFTRSATNALGIPVTGRSNPGGALPNQIALQNQAVNSNVTNKFKSAEEIQAQQGLQGLKDQPVQAANTNGANISDPSWDHISGQPVQSANTSALADMDSSWDHISGQSELPANAVAPVNMDSSWDHISGN